MLFSNIFYLLLLQDKINVVRLKGADANVIANTLSWIIKSAMKDSKFYVDKGWTLNSKKDWTYQLVSLALMTAPALSEISHILVVALQKEAKISELLSGEQLKNG